MTTPVPKDRSKCHKATVTIGGDDREGTHYYVCSECNNPCDITVMGEPAKEQSNLIDNKKFRKDVQAAIQTSEPTSLRERLETCGAKAGTGNLTHGQVLAVEAIVAQEVRKARLEELELIKSAQQDEDKWSNFCMDDTSDFSNYVEGRIQALTRTPPQKGQK